MSAKAKKKAPAKPAAKKKKAVKADAKAEETKGEPVVVTEAEPSPQATVIARHEYSSQERRGKGFSSGELSGAGLTFIIAKSLRVPIDVRRRSVLEPNVGVLKGWYKPAPKKAKEPRAEKKEQAEKPVKKAAKKAKKE
jgi:ribosomal protein L13E